MKGECEPPIVTIKSRRKSLWTVIRFLQIESFSVGEFQMYQQYISFLLSILPRCYSEFIFKHYVELRQVGVSYGVGNRYCAKICVVKQVLCIQ